VLFARGIAGSQPILRWRRRPVKRPVSLLHPSLPLPIAADAIAAGR